MEHKNIKAYQNYLYEHGMTPAIDYLQYLLLVVYGVIAWEVTGNPWTVGVALIFVVYYITHNASLQNQLGKVLLERGEQAFMVELTKYGMNVVEFVVFFPAIVLGLVLSAGGRSGK